MKKAWLLLKASRTMVGEGNRIALMIFTVVAWMFAVGAMALVTYVLIAYRQNSVSQSELGIGLLQPAFIVMGYGISRSIYTGFTEVKKESGKSNFNAWAIQLPVTKEDVIKAQFIDLLQCTLPAFLIIVYMILMTALLGGSRVIGIYSGIFVLFLSLLFLIVCIEKGFFTYFFINNRIREMYYGGVAILTAFVIYIPKELSNKIKAFSILTHSGENNKSIDYIIQGLNWLGSLGGILFLLLIGIIGYYLSCYLPKKIYRLREGRK